MTPWDGTKTTEDGDGTIDGDEQLTASEWNNHVTDGHFPADKLNFGTDVNGDPVVTDPANGDQVVLRYDPSAGQWEIVNVNLELNDNDINNVGSVQTDELAIGGVPDSLGDRTITVPDEVSWAALGDELPTHYRGTVTVNVSGDHSGEEATIEPVIEHKDPGGPLIIEGDRTTPSNAKVGGLIISASVGKRPVLVRGLQFEGIHSQADADSSMQIEGGAGSVVMSDCNFNNGNGTAGQCVSVYSGSCLLKGNIDVGAGVYGTGFNVKSNGEFFDSAGASGGDITGSVTGQLFRNAGASQYVVDTSSTAFGYDELFGPRGGFELFSGSNESAKNELADVRVRDITDVFDVSRRSLGTVDVSTTATTVFLIGGRGTLVTVVGRGGSNNSRFVDTLNVCAFGTVTVIASDIDGTVDTRSYNVAGTDLELTMGGGSYDVTAFGNRVDL